MEDAYVTSSGHHFGVASIVLYATPAIIGKRTLDEGGRGVLDGTGFLSLTHEYFELPPFK